MKDTNSVNRDRDQWKEVDERFDKLGGFWRADGDSFVTCEEEIRVFLHSELEKVRQETIKNIDFEELFLEWRKYVDDKYSEGKKTRKSQVLVSFPVWLDEWKALSIK